MYICICIMIVIIVIVIIIIIIVTVIIMIITTIISGLGLRRGRCPALRDTGGAPSPTCGAVNTADLLSVILLQLCVMIYHC